MGSIIEYDSSYVNSTGGKYKISCLVLGAIGLLACNIARLYVPSYNSAAGFAFTVTLILLLVIICKSSLTSSSLFLKIEIVVCAILTICYIVGTVDIFRTCWYFLFDHFELGHFIGSLIATICAILATLTYAYDTIFKFRLAGGSGSTSNV